MTTLIQTLSNQARNMAARSPWIYRINAGSCNGCDVECATTALIPRYDVERLGCQYCGSPRHADVLICTGPVTRFGLSNGLPAACCLARHFHSRAIPPSIAASLEKAAYRQARYCSSTPATY